MMIADRMITRLTVAAAAALILAGCSGLSLQRRESAVALPARPASFNLMSAGAGTGYDSGGITMPPDIALPVRKSTNR